MTSKKRKKQWTELPNYPKKATLIVILLLAAIVHSGSWQGDILYFDDNEYFENYEEIRDFSWENSLKYFDTDNYYVLMYHPIPVMTFAMQYKWAGGKATYARVDQLPTAGFHLFNLFFHLFNVLLAFIFIRLIFQNVNVALFATAIFAIHPLGVEAVSWISARSSVLYVFFLLLSMIAYLQYGRQLDQDKKARAVCFFVVSVLAFLLSLCSKANAIVLPGVLFAIDWLRKRRFSISLILDKLPFIALSVVFGLIAISNEGTENNMLLASQTYTGFQSFFLFTYSLLFYFLKFFLPFDLSAIYVYPPLESGSLPFKYYLSPIILFVLGFIIYRFRKERKILFGLAFFFVVLSVTLQVIPSRLFLVADRYAYLPYLGLGVSLAFIIQHFHNRLSNHWKKRIWYVFFPLFILFLSITSFQRTRVWNDTLSLVTDIIEKNPEAPYLARAHGTRAIQYQKEGKLQLALADYSKALELRPDDARTYYNKAVLEFNIGNHAAALADFTLAAENGIEIPDLYNYKGLSHFSTGAYTKAIKEFDKAIALDSSFAFAWGNKGVALASMEKTVKALAALNRAISLKANYADALKNRGIIYLRRNDRSKACSDLLAAKMAGARGVQELINLNKCE